MSMLRIKLNQVDQNNGIERGRKQGEKDGEKKGSREEKIKIAINMLKLQMNTEIICQITELNKEEINKLKEKI